MKKYNFGWKALNDALSNNGVINEVHVLESNVKAIRLLNLHNISYTIEKPHFFNHFNGVNHQGVCFVMKENMVVEKSIDELINQLKNEQNALILMLDHIQDPGNFGAILRTANAFGVNAVIYSKNNQAAINDHVIKTSMGAVNYLNLIKVSNLNIAIEKLKQINFFIYASTLNNEALSYSKVDYASKTCIVVGNEDIGVRMQVVKNSDLAIYIPMIGNVQSLNVSVATGILLANFRMKNK
ncbi:23S rRNA (guanosine(2251)-2'-O)-methyltransferase RlmB [Ureaplasma canigenitalium]|uniref:23S rRNA (guanosine(2251)-2'-O)-methyltransferase RlmB n=1 Tax=Ureaplasma canigenitalium TaxID=42092 RepID=UPI0004E16A9F|nr:23S rRNA (guanosine(2251)-2'-O)-methyltransferase RlmB [Ureaplasma canigenitalium]